MVTVAYIGNFGPEHSTENDVRRSFLALGHDVIRLQENTTNGRAVMDAMYESDLLLYTRTWGALNAELPAIFKTAKQMGVPTAGFHLDLWHGLPRRQELQHEAMFQAQFVFTADGGHPDEWRALGINHRWLPPGVLADSCYLAPPDIGHWGGIDVAFVGSRGYHPEWPHRAELVDFLRVEYGDRFMHVGGDGDTGTVRGADLNGLYATVPVVVGDGCLLGERYWSDRVPETLGRGGVLLHPANPDLRLLYPKLNAPTLHYWPLGDWGSLRDRVAELSSKPIDVAERLATTQWVREHHSYAARMQTLLSTVGLA